MQTKETLILLALTCLMILFYSCSSTEFGRELKKEGTQALKEIGKETLSAGIGAAKEVSKELQEEIKEAPKKIKKKIRELRKK